jgi:hypothetical protein
VAHKLDWGIFLNEKFFNWVNALAKISIFAPAFEERYFFFSSQFDRSCPDASGWQLAVSDVGNFLNLDVTKALTANC